MLYAAYGSNLNKSQMDWRCPGSEVVGVAVIKDYRLMFKGSKTGAYLTIEKEKGCEVPVALWKVTEDHIKRLDRYEGFPDFYYKKTFLVDGSDGKRHRVFAYVMHEDRELATPSKHYMDVCRQGYADFGFEIDTLTEAWEYSRRSA